MLLALWSPKGGSGTSVLAAACSLVLARRGPAGARLADLDGDQPALFGLAHDPDTGLADWLDAGPTAPPEALTRFAIEAAPGVVLLPYGRGGGALAPVAAAEAGAALAVILRDDPVPTVIDLGRAEVPAARAVLEVADAAVLVTRGCYLTLRRAAHAPGLARTAGIAMLEEPGRSLDAKAVADVLALPVVARVPVRAGIAQAVDAGVLPSRLPDHLARPASHLLMAFGLLPGSRKRAA